MTGQTDVRELLERAQHGDSSAYDQVIRENTRLVHAIVRRFADRGAEYEDLFQIGCIGLIKAVRNFDLDYGVRFSTYAVPMIMGEVRRYLRDDSLVKVSRSTKEQAYKIMQAQEELRRTLGRSPTMEELARHLGMPREEISYALEALVAPISLDAPLSSEDTEGTSPLQLLHDGSAQEEETVNHILLSQLLQTLSERERLIVTMRYFQDKTQAEIASRLGVSQVQVSRLESRILARLRELAGIETA